MATVNEVLQDLSVSSVDECAKLPAAQLDRAVLRLDASLRSQFTEAIRTARQRPFWMCREVFTVADLGCDSQSDNDQPRLRVRAGVCVDVRRTPLLVCLDVGHFLPLGGVYAVSNRCVVSMCIIGGAAHSEHPLTSGAPPTASSGPSQSRLASSVFGSW